MIHITHGKVHPHQPVFEATLGRRRGTCLKEANTSIPKYEDQN